MILTKTPRVLGVIPARGGSKRLTRKNIRDLAGIPLIAHTIKAAAGAKGLTDFLVSSDDEEIISVANAFGAPTPFKRPDEISGDNVTNKMTVVHALEFMEQNNPAYDIVVLLQPTSPLRQSSHIDAAIQKLWVSDLPTLASVIGPIKKNFQVLKALRDDVLVAFSAEARERAPFYLYNAAIYAAKCDYVRKTGDLMSEKQVHLWMDKISSVDIDTEYDLAMAEAAIAWNLKNISRSE